MSLPVLVSLFVGVIAGHAAGLWGFMLYRHRGIRGVVFTALGFATFVGITCVHQAAMVELPLLKWLEMQQPQILAICLTAIPTFAATVAFWTWYAQPQESKADCRD